MSEKRSIKEKLSEFSTYSQELGLDLRNPEDRFKWFLASILFSKRISSEIAKRTYREFERERIVTPEAVIEAGWDRLVQILDNGGYVRYDFSTASNLVEMANELKKRYVSLENLYREAQNSKELEKRLMEFKGVGPITVNIFLRELKPIWKKANPLISPLAKEVMDRLSLGEELIDDPLLESRLVRLNLEFCKKRKCSLCPVKDECKRFKK